jgi:hypothetical protein
VGSLRRAREEDELQLGDHGSRHPEEEVVEAAVVEVVLDSGAADPTDAAVDDDEFTMIEVSEPAEVPGARAARGGRLRSCARTRGVYDAHIHPSVEEPLVELAAGPVGAGALCVHDEPDHHSLGRLGQQGGRELAPDGARPEPELVDVDR